MIAEATAPCAAVGRSSSSTMKRLKVFFLTRSYPTQQSPVQGTYVRDQVRAIQVHNDVSVVHCAGRSDNRKALWQVERELDPAFCSESVPTYRIWERDLGPLASIIRVGGVFAAYRRVLERGFRPQIIHANFHQVGIPACALARRYRLPVVISEHSSEFQRKSLSRSRIWGARLAFRQADVVMPVSRSLQAALEDCGISANYRVVPNSVDISLFSPACRPQPGTGTQRLLCVGILEPLHKKGIPFLFQALAELQSQRRDWHLDLVGDGPTRFEYERLAEDLKILRRVTFHGRRGKNEIARHLQECSFLVSASHHETFGVVLLEALASGRPVVAVDGGGPAEIVKQDMGILVPPDDPAALARALSHMLDHAKEYAPQHLATHIRRNYSHEVVGGRLNAIYHQARS